MHIILVIVTHAYNVSLVRKGTGATVKSRYSSSSFYHQGIYLIRMGSLQLMVSTVKPAKMVTMGIMNNNRINIFS